MPQIAFLTLRVNPETRGEAMRRRIYENEADIKRGGERRKEKIKCKSFRVEEKKRGEGVAGNSEGMKNGEGIKRGRLLTVWFCLVVDSLYFYLGKYR